jgi:hypothetical protein
MQNKISKSIFYSLFGLCLIISKLHARDAKFAWDKFLSVSDSSSISSIRILPDGGYITVGSFAAIAGGGGIFLARMNSNGDKLWVQTWEGPEQKVTGVQVTLDGGFVLVGTIGLASRGNESIGKQVWILKTNGSGQVQWEKKLGGLGNDYGLGIILDNNGDYMVHSDKSHWYPELNDVNSGSPNTNSPVAFDIIQTDDGHFILVGKEWNINFRGGSWLVKLDSNCKSIFNFTPSSESTNSRLGQIFSALLPTNEGGVFIAGANLGDIPGPPNWFLEEQNSAGVRLWLRILKQEIKVYSGSGPKPKALISHSQGEFAILADTALVLFDTTGKEEWMPTPGSRWSMMIKSGASSAILAGTRDGQGYLARYDFETTIESGHLEIVQGGLQGKTQHMIYKGSPNLGKLFIPLYTSPRGVQLITIKSGSKQIHQLMILR